MFRYLGLLAVFLPLSAESQIFVEQEDHLPTFSKRLELHSDPFVVPGRYRIARMDRNEVLRSLEHEAPLVFNLFNDVEMRADVQKVKELASGSTFVSGELAGGGHFTFLVHNSGLVRGELHSIRGVYTLKSEGTDFNQVLIKQEDLSGVTLCGNELDGGHAQHGEERGWIPNRVRNDVFPAGKSAGVSAKQGTNNTVDVLVVYTQRVEDYEGGPAQAQAFVESEIAKMNQVLENSGLSHRQIKLAHMAKVDYVQDPERMRNDPLIP